MKPWEIEGVSKATYYRRLAKERGPTPRQLQRQIDDLTCLIAAKRAAADLAQAELTSLVSENLRLKKMLLDMKWA